MLSLNDVFERDRFQVLILENYGGKKHVFASIQSITYIHRKLGIQHAWGWCVGMTQRDVVGREVGGGFMFGIACYTRGGFMSMYGKTNTVL